MFCTNCGTKFEGSFCPNCGTPAAKINNPDQRNPLPEQSDISQNANEEKASSAKPKKITFIIIIAVLIILLAALFLSKKAKENSESDSSKTNGNVLSISSTLNNSNSSVYSFHDLNFRIPSRFVFNSKNSTDDTIFFYDSFNQNAYLLSLQRAKSTISDKEFNSSAQYADTYENGFLNSAGNFSSHTKNGFVNLADQTGIWYHAEGKVNGIDATMENVISQYNGTIYVVTLCKSNSISQDLVPVFKDIIGSAKVGTIQSSASSETSVESPTTENNIRPEIKKAIDSYASFMNEYIDFMKKYKKNPTDMSLLSDYSTYMSKYADMVNKINALKDKNLTTEETVYYTEVTLDIEKRMVEVLK